MNKTNKKKINRKKDVFAEQRVEEQKYFKKYDNLRYGQQNENNLRVIKCLVFI